MTNTLPSPSDSNDSARLILPWRSVAAASLFVTLAALTGLVIIADTKRADTLSTTALVLAIVAFIAQLMIFVVQTGAATNQERRSADISANTLGLLAEIRATSAGSERLLRDQFGMILNQLLRTAIPRGVREAANASKKDFDPEEFRRNIARSIDESVRAQLGDAYPGNQKDGPQEHDEWKPPRLSRQAKKALGLLQSWPDRDDAARAHAELTELAPMCLLQLVRIADDHVLSLQLAIEPGMYGSDDSLISEKLVGLHLVQRSEYVPDSDEDNSKYRYTLSDHGLEVARLLTAPLGDMPEYVKELDLSHEAVSQS